MKDERALRAAQQSWRGRFLRDAYTDAFGVVLHVEEREEELFLWARFEGEAEERLVSLSERKDGEFTDPDNIRARYRPASRIEIAAKRG